MCTQVRQDDKIFVRGGDREGDFMIEMAGALIKKRERALKVETDARSR